MNAKYDFPGGAEDLVYVKAVEVASLPDEVRAEAGDREHLYAVHNAEGEQLALVADRSLAFLLARQNDLSPVTVH
ncbi:MAG: DUF1150 family protein [Pseudomonadota bacterium]